MADVIIGDVRQVLDGVEPESVQCCVTSPPYWGLRDYGHEGQIGAESSPGEHVEHLTRAFRKVWRVRAKDGTIWLNIGDGYARNGGVGHSGPNAQVRNTRKEIQKRNLRVPTDWRLKDRDLPGIPWRVAFALQEDGWLLRSHITWIKREPMPESGVNRPSNATEDIFLFTKSPCYYYDSQAVRVLIADGVAQELGFQQSPAAQRISGQTAGARFEEITRNFIQEAFSALSLGQSHDEL